MLHRPVNPLTFRRSSSGRPRSPQPPGALVRGAAGSGLTFVGGQQLAEAEVVAADALQVVLLQGPLDHLGGVVLAGQLGGRRKGGGAVNDDTQVETFFA